MFIFNLLIFISFVLCYRLFSLSWEGGVIEYVGLEFLSDGLFMPSRSSRLFKGGNSQEEII
jgi:hypothetical protein